MQPAVGSSNFGLPRSRSISDQSTTNRKYAGFSAVIAARQRSHSGGTSRTPCGHTRFGFCSVRPTASSIPGKRGGGGVGVGVGTGAAGDGAAAGDGGGEANGVAAGATAAGSSFSEQGPHPATTRSTAKSHKRRLTAALVPGNSDRGDFLFLRHAE